MYVKCKQGSYHLLVVFQLHQDLFSFAAVQQIKWSCSALGGTLTIELSTDNGNSWKTLSSSTAYDAAYFEYTPVAAEISDECLVKISSNDHPGVSEISKRFNIFKPTKNYVAKQFFCSLDPITLDGKLTEPI